MRLLNGCLLLLAAGLAILLGIVGAGAVFALIAGSPDGSRHWLVVVAWLLYAALLLATAILVISLRLPYRRVPEAPGGWLAIIVGMALLLASPIIGGLFLGKVAEGSGGWIAGLAMEAVAECAMFLVIVRGVRAVAIGAESLRLPRSIVRVIISGPGSPAEVVNGLVAAMRHGVLWLLTADRRQRPGRVVVAAIAQAISGAVIVAVGLAFTGREGYGWFVAWGGLTFVLGIGIYLQIRLARGLSVAMSVPTAFLAGLALAIGGGWEGGPLWQFLAIGLVFISSLLVLYALGWLGRVLAYVLSN